MTRLKLADLADEKPVRLTVEVSARLHRDLMAYAAALNGGDAKGAPPPERLIPPMIERFIATDRSFAKTRRSAQPG
ncbi:MAG: DUF2274 domain-containing protein [Sphingomonas sp.]|uniref:DUF2274 domain-containing protein n=1 Tax=Sphingomonas sp. TaxID=28214 RepID=UPI002603EDB1|nr:DUF2274 domain-containing protein [Sphingomonas sp.]MDK2770333.1 DUF2274 domain-containing protein [Sphingomonas sp.]